MSKQLQIDFTYVGFNGADYDPALDNIRLGTQTRDVFEIMKDGRKRTLYDIARLTGHPESSVSAQLRHLRKKRFGSWDVRKERKGESGTWYYWIEGKL
jgi:hypothetical protein